MKKILFAFILLTSAETHAQLVADAEGLSITAGETLSYEGLQLTPSADFIINNNTLQRIDLYSISPAPTGYYIKRYYQFTNTTAAFAGTLRFSYLGADLNGSDAVAIAESDLRMNLYNGSVWSEFTDAAVEADDYLSSSITSNTLNTITLGKSSSTLPVSWLAFNAVRANNHVVVNWQTTAEQNAQDFIVQHSSNAQNWKQLGIVAATGNSTAFNSYQFVHAQPVTGNNYYRLLQRDKNGATTYSTIETVKFAAGNNSFTVTSNTVTNGLLRVAVTEPATLRLFTGNGQLLQQYRLAQGTHTLTLSAYAKGIYFINGNGKTERFMIQ